MLIMNLPFHKCPLSVSCWVFALMALTGCANVGTLSGGAKDVRPPQLDTLASTPNLQTNFTQKELTFVFDEFIQLDNPNAQILISPPLRYPYEVSARNKTLVFEFNDRDTLKENTTYTVNFGSAIKDLTEGNVQPLRFVFSTGPVIDSLTVKGRLVDAKTDEPIPDALFMLYEQFEDSVVFLERPFYFGKTNKTGQFLIENIGQKTFKAFALADENLDYLYQLSETMGFLETDTVRVDTVAQFFTVRLSKAYPDPSAPILETPYYGLTKLIFPSIKQANSVEIITQNDRPTFELERKLDTVLLWTNPLDSADFQIIVTNDSRLDTINIKQSRIKKTSPSLELAQRSKGGRNSTAQPLRTVDTLALVFNQPIRQIEQKRISVFKDSVNVPFELSLSENNRTLIVFPENGLTAKSNYRLQVDSNALTGHFQRVNDSVSQSFIIKNPDELGTVILNFTNLDSTQAYFYRVLKEGTTQLASGRINNSASQTDRHPGLEPGLYEIELVKDDNANGVWDPGDYWLRKQPERIIRFKTEELRPNWELESVIEPNFEPRITTDQEE